ncbi:Transcription factor Spi-C, partial [Galemys pyrenaicus]
PPRSEDLLCPPAHTAQKERKRGRVEGGGRTRQAECTPAGDDPMRVKSSAARRLEAGHSWPCRAAPLLLQTPASRRNPPERAREPVADPSPMMSALVDRQRHAPDLAATSFRALAPPPPLVLASGSGSGSRSGAVSLEAGSASNFHVGLPAGAGVSSAATARWVWRLSVRVVTFDASSLTRRLYIGFFAGINVGIKVTDTSSGYYYKKAACGVLWKLLSGPKSWSDGTQSTDVAPGWHRGDFEVLRACGPSPAQRSFAPRACVEQDRLGQDFEDAFEVLKQHSSGDLHYNPDYKNYLTFINHCSHVRGNSSCYSMLPPEESVYNWRAVINSATDLYLDGNIHQSLQNIPENQLTPPAILQSKGGKGRKKLRLFEYLHESLNNPEMASCIQWIDKNKGIFQFVSKNKEKLAQLWGKRKGNRKTMTYQKMARALRNYGRTGEITKIRRKLTYQFSEAILQRLSPSYFLEKEFFYSPYIQPDQNYLSLNTWHANYNSIPANYPELSHPVC